MIRNLSIAVVFILCLSGSSLFAEEKPDNVWYSQTGEGSVVVNLYFFWSKKCPHCREAVPFVAQLDNSHGWLTVYSRELTEHPEYVEQYIEMAAQLGQEVASVPAFMWCGNMMVGYDAPDNMGRFLEQELVKCYEWLKNNSVQPKPALENIFETPVITLPLIGTLSLKDYSLPVYTFILAGLDAFNPCAFFVLLFLLSLLVHAKSRQRMLITGGVFVLFSGLMYFLFMAAWLNVFLLMGKINAITIGAGVVAVVMASLNIKDYFWFRQGVSLSIPDSAKPTLYQRTRRLVTAGSLPAMIMATMGLAAFANLYEFLCTAGFPMVFTRILTLEELPAFSYYLYLILYNVVYIIPLLIIVIVFTLTFGVKKLQEAQGRRLKLLSGVMMLLLGLVLIMAPDLLNNVVAAVALLFGALLLTSAIIYLHRFRYSASKQ
ncbi:MAG: thioredoxin family protein [Gammaproteobacteria bacterium]|nr:thioredoxin family protein [Gammaproteobacteria bacterium]